MKKYRNDAMVFLTISLLVLSSIVTISISKSDDDTNFSEITIEKYVRLVYDTDDCLYHDDINFKDHVYAKFDDFVQFILYVNNTGDSGLDINVWDDIPDGLLYNNHAYVDGVAKEPLFVDSNTCVWNLSDVTAGQCVIITYMAIVKDCGVHVNTAYLTGPNEYSSIYNYDTAIVELSCDEYEIIIDKWVKNGDSWAEYTEVSLGDIVCFKGEVYNPNDYDIDFSGVIYDVFPDNLKYVNESCSLLDLSEHLVEIVDPKNNSVYWHRIPILEPGESHIFYFNATAIDCGLEVNNLYTEADVIIGNTEKIPVNDSDDATVFVNCNEAPQISIEKMVWDECGWSEYTEVSLGDIVNFRVEVYNPNPEAVIRFSGYIYDIFPDNLRYVNGSLKVLREDNKWDEIVDWENNMVNWSMMKEIYPGEYINFTYNATAVDCGLGVNNIFVVAYTKIGETVYNLTGSDDTTVYVNCTPQEEANISVEKYVKRDCSTPYQKEVDAEIGDYVVFKLYVNNTGDTPLDITVIDELPAGLNYSDYATPEPDEVNGKTLKWIFTDVQPEASIVITFYADVVECGEQVNQVSVTGIYEDQEVNDQDTATVNVDCPDEPGIEVIKSVKENCCGEYSDYVEIEIDEWVTFRINVTNIGDTILDITITDTLPQGLTYNNNAYPKEPDYQQGNEYIWYFENVNPEETITITFEAIGSDYGEHENLVNVTGLINEEIVVFEEDSATVNVICSNDPSLEIGIEKGLKIGNLNGYVKNKNKNNVNNVEWAISVKNIGFFNRIDSITNDIINILEPEEIKTLETENIWGLGFVEINLKASTPDTEQITKITKGLILGNIIIIL